MFLSTAHANRLKSDAFDTFQPPAHDPLAFSFVQSFSHDVHSFRGGRGFGRGRGRGMFPGHASGAVHARGPSITGSSGASSVIGHHRTASRVSNAGVGHHRTPSEIKRSIGGGSGTLGVNGPHGRRASLSHQRTGSVALAAGLGGTSSSGPSHSFTKVFGAPLQLPAHVPEPDRPLSISLSGINGAAAARGVSKTDEKDSKDNHGDDDHNDDEEVYNDLSKHVFNQLKRR
jgi:hypothetical protein